MDLQMELKGENLQIHWKPIQEKNTRNQIMIYGLPTLFDTKGGMRKLLYGLKECEKELCNGQRFSLEENMAHYKMPLTLFNGIYKQATPPKATTHLEGVEMSLNKNKECMENGCELFHLEYNPMKNGRMDPVWTQFIQSGRTELFLGHRYKIFVLPVPGQQDPHQITLICCYMKFHCR
jgi:hypothetical protein